MFRSQTASKGTGIGIEESRLKTNAAAFLLFFSALFLISSIALFGCHASESIVGKWKSDSSGALMQFDNDGTFSYTNSTITELGILKGTWERYTDIPTVEADGSEWSVYKFTTEVDDGKDYFYLVNGDEMALTIGKGNIESISEKHELTSMSKQFISHRV